MSTRSLVMFPLVSVLAAAPPAAAKDVATAPVNPPTALRNSLPLPAIPHLETVPWLLGESVQPVTRQKVDTLLGPNFENIELGASEMKTRDASMQRSP